MNIEITLAVGQEMQLRFNEIGQLRKQQVERFKYEADLAKRRFINVDPENRLVASTSEAEWNEKLRTFHNALEEYDSKKQQAIIKLDENKNAAIQSLVKDFPALWNNPNTSHREKKTVASFNHRRMLL